MKYVVVLGDGMADWPLKALGGRTPLDAARHPFMDRLARDGELGLVRTVPEGMKPGSDIANLSVIGYDPRLYYTGRSPLEAASLGISLSLTDVTYRCNFVTLMRADRLEHAAMVDYSAGEIGTAEASVLVAFLNERLADGYAHLHTGLSYRHCFVLHDGQTGAELIQPHDIPGESVSGKLPAGANAALLGRWMRDAYQLLGEHPLNRARAASGKNPANAIWFWGEGRKPDLPSFFGMTGLDGAVVSAVDLIQGIGVCAGMRVLRVPGVTGTWQTNFSGKAQAAIDALMRGVDYVYVHLEAPDECGHHGQLEEKIDSIAQIDEKVLGPIFTHLEASEEPYALLVLPDHPTPIALRTHTSDPVPFVLYRKGDVAHRNARYCERDAADTGVFVEAGHTLLARMRAQDR